MTDASRPLMQGLLSELANEEMILGEVAHDLATARNKWEVASRKYAAVRDMVIDQLEKSPYLLSDQEWPSEPMFIGPYERGAFRFVRMDVGDAVVLAMQEAATPLTLDELVERLADARGVGSPRAVNAALMRTGGVKKDEDRGTYTYEPEESTAPSTPDDLPF